MLAAPGRCAGILATIWCLYSYAVRKSPYLQTPSWASSMWRRNKFAYYIVVVSAFLHQYGASADKERGARLIYKDLFGLPHCGNGLNLHAVFSKLFRTNTQVTNSSSTTSGNDTNNDHETGTLQAMVPHIKYEYIGNEQNLTFKRKLGAFVIASVCNPCAYYLTLWQSQHKTPWASRQDRDVARWHNFSVFDFNGSGLHWNLTTFQNWLRVTTGKRSKGIVPHGMMSYLFWQSLAVQRNWLPCRGSQFMKCARHFSDSIVEAGLRELPKRSMVDCWVHLDVAATATDLVRCLHLFGEVSGTQINWNQFRDVFAEAWRKHNRTYNRDDCKRTLNDTLVVEHMIKKADMTVFNTFGYAQCCGKPTKRLRDLPIYGGLP